MDKQSIIDVARRMFYEQGIQDVSVKQMAEACSVAPSLISYYFKNKTAIVTSVITEYSQEIEKVISRKLYQMRIPYTLEIVSILDLLVKLELYEQDEKARTFVLEYLNCGMDVIFSANFDSIYRQLDQHVILDIDRSYDQITSVAAAAHGVVLSMMYGYFSGKLNCTYDQFIDFTLDARCRLLNVMPEKIKPMIREAKELRDRMHLTVKPFFVIE